MELDGDDVEGRRREVQQRRARFRRQLLQAQMQSRMFSVGWIRSPTCVAMVARDISELPSPAAAVSGVGIPRPASPGGPFFRKLSLEDVELKGREIPPADRRTPDTGIAKSASSAARNQPVVSQSKGTHAPDVRALSGQMLLKRQLPPSTRLRKLQAGTDGVSVRPPGSETWSQRQWKDYGDFEFAIAHSTEDEQRLLARGFPQYPIFVRPLGHPIVRHSSVPSCS